VGSSSGDAVSKAADRLDAERYRALRDYRLEFFPYFFFKAPALDGKYAIKVPSNDYEADEAVDQMIERYRSYDKQKPR